MKVTPVNGNEWLQSIEENPLSINMRDVLMYEKPANWSNAARSPGSAYCFNPPRSCAVCGDDEKFGVCCSGPGKHFICVSCFKQNAIVQNGHRQIDTNKFGNLQKRVGKIQCTWGCHDFTSFDPPNVCTDQQFLDLVDDDALLLAYLENCRYCIFIEGRVAQNFKVLDLIFDREPEVKSFWENKFTRDSLNADIGPLNLKQCRECGLGPVYNMDCSALYTHQGENGSDNQCKNCKWFCKDWVSISSLSTIYVNVTVTNLFPEE